MEIPNYIHLVDALVNIDGVLTSDGSHRLLFGTHTD